MRYVGTLGLTITLAGPVQRVPIHEAVAPGDALGLGHSHVEARRVGALEGFVRLAGDTIPQPTRVANTTDPGVCSELQSLEDLLLSERTRGLRNVIVALIDVPESAASTSVPEQIVLDNRDCRFEPHVSVLTTGSTIVAANSDPLLHTVHYYGALRKNLSLPRQGIRRPQIVEEPGMIVVKCDVHGWMQAFIRVDAHPFHAVTGPEGAFRIVNIPEGEYTVELWHEKLGTQRTTVRIEAGETTTLEAEYLWTRSALESMEVAG